MAAVTSEARERGGIAGERVEKAANYAEKNSLL